MKLRMNRTINNHVQDILDLIKLYDRLLLY